MNSNHGNVQSALKAIASGLMRKSMAKDLQVGCHPVARVMEPQHRFWAWGPAGMCLPGPGSNLHNPYWPGCFAQQFLSLGRPAAFCQQMLLPALRLP